MRTFFSKPFMIRFKVVTNLIFVIGDCFFQTVSWDRSTTKLNIMEGIGTLRINYLIGQIKVNNIHSFRYLG